jgi:hypothetical protein
MESVKYNGIMEPQTQPAASCAAGGRVVPLYRERVCGAVRRAGLDAAWTVERCAEYLLLCGAATDAAWLARTLGDWKSATLIGLAVTKHRHMLPALYTRYAVCPELLLSLHTHHHYTITTQVFKADFKTMWDIIMHKYMSYHKFLCVTRVQFYSHESLNCVSYLPAA